MNTVQAWHIVPYGEAALLVEADAERELANHAVLALAVHLDHLALPHVSLVQPALTSLLLRFDPLRTTHAAVEQQVRSSLDQLDVVPAPPTHVVTIPVRYGGDDGPDLDHVAHLLGIRNDEVIALHTGQVYRVQMIGFAPGFPYIGPLPPELTLPRRSTPRTAVPAGSVAIAAGMTGIYPQRLPGGWHIIGRTDVILFDPLRSPPALLQPGDGVRFVNNDQ